MACSHCGSAVPDDARFCDVCGAPIETPVATTDKNKRLITVTACTCAIIIIAAVIFVIAWQFIQEGNERAARPHGVTISIQASGYSDSDTRIPVQAAGSTYGGSNIDELFFVNAAGEGIELPKGEYELSIPASPLTQDGILYKIPSETTSLVVPEDTGDDEPVDARDSSALTMEKGTALDETDEDIVSAYEYAMKDPEQAERANRLKERADQAHSAAAAQQLKQRKISQGLYYECPYYIIDLPESMAGKASIDTQYANPIHDVGGGLLLGYDTTIELGGGKRVFCTVFKNWGPQGDFENIKIFNCTGGYQLYVFESWEQSRNGSQGDRVLPYISAIN